MISFIAVMAVLATLCAVLLIRAGRNDSEFRYLSSLTPTPSAVPHKVSYIYDSQTPAPTAMRISTGAMGQAVYDVQERLRALGYYTGAVDAQFGPGTLDAVKRFQSENGLKADGIVGGETYRVMMSPSAKPCPTAAP